jgi:hypothetical protein
MRPRKKQDRIELTKAYLSLGQLRLFLYSGAWGNMLKWEQLYKWDYYSSSL